MWQGIAAYAVYQLMYPVLCAVQLASKHSRAQQAVYSQVCFEAFKLVQNWLETSPGNDCSCVLA